MCIMKAISVYKVAGSSGKKFMGLQVDQDASEAGSNYQKYSFKHLPILNVIWLKKQFINSAVDLYLRLFHIC
jgi:hypothetical protein